MATTCSSLKCKKIRPSQQRRVVWTINGNPYCNVCFMDWMDANVLTNERIVRLFEDDELYNDTRIQRRRSRRPQMEHPGMALHA